MAEYTLQNAPNEELIMELARRLGLQVDDGKNPGDIIGTDMGDPVAGLAQPSTRPLGGFDYQENATPGPRAGERVVRTKSTADRVYLLDETAMTRQWLTNPEVLSDRGFTLNDVVEIEEDEFLKYQQRQAIYATNA